MIRCLYRGIMKLYSDSLPGVYLIILSVMILLVTGCSSGSITATIYQPVIVKKPLPRLGYTIQAGAFSKVENAARLTNYLNEQNLDAYYFAYRKGLYKVRLGRFNKSAKMTGLQPCCGILGSEPAKDEQGGKKRAIRKIKRYRNAHKFVIRQYESTGYDFDDGNCRGEKLIVTQAEQASVWI